MIEWFQAERVSARITKITDLTEVFMYLVQGDAGALLIDTGSGIGDLHAFVRTLTGLPLTAFCTHGHVDHAGGAARFGEVCLAEADWGLVARHATADMKRGYLDHINPEASGRIADGDIQPARTKAWLPLSDGQTFDLGGVHVEIRALPGHTQGMSCALIIEERALILGDACNPCTFLFGEGSSCVSDYRQALLQFKRFEPGYDTVYMSHGATTVPKPILDGVINVCDDILTDRADAIPFQFMGETPLLAKAVGAQMIRVDGGLGNIVYDPRRIG